MAIKEGVEFEIREAVHFLREGAARDVERSEGEDAVLDEVEDEADEGRDGQHDAKAHQGAWNRHIMNVYIYKYIYAYIHIHTNIIYTYKCI